MVDEELPYRIFRRATRLGLRAAEEAAKTTARIARSVPRRVPRPAGGEENAVPFRRRPRRGSMHRSPLDSRPAGVMEYHRLPSIRLDDIIGASTAVGELRRALREGAGKLLLAGPPGVGKSVLALAYAAELGKSIIDVNSGDPEVHANSGTILEEVFEEAAEGDYTVIFYNIEGLLNPEYAGKVIIYDPYTDLESGGGRLIIYDPYTDSQPERLIIHESHSKAVPAPARILEKALSTDTRIIATTTSPTILPPRLRRGFESTIRVPLPGYRDRLEILSNLAGGRTLAGHRVDLLAAMTRGASAADLVRLAERLSSGGGRLEEIVSNARFAGDIISEALYP